MKKPEWLVMLGKHNTRPNFLAQIQQAFRLAMGDITRASQTTLD